MTELLVCKSLIFMNRPAKSVLALVVATEHKYQTEMLEKEKHRDMLPEDCHVDSTQTVCRNYSDHYTIR